VKPLHICQQLGRPQIDAFYDELSGKEVRAVLKAGGSHAGVPATAYTRSQRLKAWRRRFDNEFDSGNEQLALALLIEWLMRHHRSMLVDYLETDEDFCETRTPEQLREGVDMLLGKYPAQHVGVYLLLVGHLQETVVFDQTPKVLEALGMSKADAQAYVDEHVKNQPPADKGAA
jgi:hypothetical protein